MEILEGYGRQLLTKNLLSDLLFVSFGLYLFCGIGNSNRYGMTEMLLVVVINDHLNS